MLIDRSLRSMAAFTMICAIVMFIVIFCYMNAFTKRKNKNITSIGGGKGVSCETLKKENLVCSIPKFQHINMLYDSRSYTVLVLAQWLTLD